MLKNIKYHLDDNEESQAESEKKVAQHLSESRTQNINAFQRYIPSVGSYLAPKSQNTSIFYNKLGLFNIVDYSTGRALYGIDCHREIDEHIKLYSQHAEYMPFAQKSHEFDGDILNYKSNCQSLPHEIEVLVVLGCGLGRHLESFVNNYAISHLIVYEPESQYFSCSALVQNWKVILETAKNKGTNLYLQIGKDGRDLIEDISELNEHFDVSGFYFYQHYNHPVFNEVYKSLISRGWPDLKAKGFSLDLREDINDYTPIWSASLDVERYRGVESKEALKDKNLAAFKKYFPDIYAEFADYQPSHWQPYLEPGDVVNLFKKDRPVSWHHKAHDEGTQSYEFFKANPNKDGLVLGYNGEKLKNYLHYEFVRETQKLISDGDAKETLPDNIKSIILFGLGTGYQLQTLFEKHQVENLFICEPNRDFFYASLYAINWWQILEFIDDKGWRIYLNIGDDGTNLFRDLLNQFYSIGPYILANTYFYQSYFNSSLSKAVSQLREQLTVVISMGEYFDHAYYGINHTQYMLKQGVPVLVKQSQKSFDCEQGDTPVFIVGNGPSLDASFEHIQEVKDKAIIISCGTALQSLYKKGIVPDFHAEIEQNRSTYDWVSRVGDYHYLKRISLISCNGIHPDTCELFKDTFIAFKEGESSTVSVQDTVADFNCEILKFAFPTVGNFALNLFLKMGFKQIYLFGIDLGFISKDYHHSLSSGYYNNAGQQMYDYSSKNNMSLPTAGNFRAVVETKHEFKVARILMEQALQEVDADVYNTSDGAKILGTYPLKAEDILITNECKQSTINAIKSSAFKPLDDIATDYEHKFNKQVYRKEIEAFVEKASQEVNSNDELEKLVDSQRNMLFASYQHGRSLLFYYLYGTVNYVNALLLKVSSDEFNKEVVTSILDSWLSLLTKIKRRTLSEIGDFDCSSSISSERVLAVLRNRLKGEKLLGVDSRGLMLKALHSVIEQDVFIEAEALSFEQACQQGCLEHYCIVHIHDEQDQASFQQVIESGTTFSNKVIVISGIWLDVTQYPEHFTFLFYTQDKGFELEGAVENNIYSRVWTSLEYLSLEHDFKVILPKFMLAEDDDVAAYYLFQEDSREYLAFDNVQSIGVVYPKMQGDNIRTITFSASRGRLLNSEKVMPEDLVISRMPKDFIVNCNRHILKYHPFVVELNQSGLK